MIRDATGVTVEIGEMLAEIRHSVTRYRIRLLCYLAEHRAGSPNAAGDFSWVRPADFGEYPLSVTGRRFAKLLVERGKRSYLAER
jgi:A/G-specific adenine glycosylase